MKRNKLIAITILLLLIAGAAYGQWQKIGKEQLPTNLGDTAADSLATAEIRAADATGLSLKDDGGNLGVFVEDGGQVGIGTSAPFQDVAGGSADFSDGGLHIEDPVLARFIVEGPASIIELIDINATTNARVMALVNDSGYTRFHSRNDDLTTRTGNILVIRPDGKVGVGIAAPTQLFHVEGVGVSEVIALFDGQLTNFNRIVIDGGAGGDTQTSYMNNGSTKWSVGNDAGTDSFIISKGYGAFGTSDYVTIDTNGDVGIGTTNPSAPLEVSHTSPALQLIDTNGDDWLVHVDGDNFSIKEGVYGAGPTTRVTILDDSGNVGIGTTTPTNLLDLNGGFRTRSTTFNLDSDPIHNAAIGDYSFVKLTADSSGFELTGIVAGYDGQHLWLINRDGDLDQIDLMHNDAGSIAGNQFENPTGLTVSTDPGDAVELLYDSSGDGGSGAWVIVNVYQ